MQIIWSKCLPGMILHQDIRTFWQTYFSNFFRLMFFMFVVSQVMRNSASPVVFVGLLSQVTNVFSSMHGFPSGSSNFNCKINGFSNL